MYLDAEALFVNHDVGELNASGARQLVPWYCRSKGWLARRVAGELRATGATQLVRRLEAAAELGRSAGAPLRLGVICLCRR